MHQYCANKFDAVLDAYPKLLEVVVNEDMVSKELLKKLDLKGTKIELD